MREIKITARPWQPQDLLDDLQQMIDEQPDNYLNTDRQTLCTAKAYLEEHFAEPKWIPVTERLPEPMEWVLCACRANIIEVLRYDDLMKDWDTPMPNRAYMFGFVTHWMPLPEPPKENDHG